MADCSFRLYPDPILREKCNNVEDFSTLDNDIEIIYSIMKEKNCAGLAGPQFGLRKNVVGARIGGGKPRIFVNPKIVKSVGDTLSLEYCLSLPNYLVPIFRKVCIQVEYLDEKKNRKTDEFNGYDSIILQHEIDHLNGRLMIDPYLSFFNGMRNLIAKFC